MLQPALSIEQPTFHAHVRDTRASSEYPHATTKVFWYLSLQLRYEAGGIDANQQHLWDTFGPKAKSIDSVLLSELSNTDVGGIANRDLYARIKRKKKIRKEKGKGQGASYTHTDLVFKRRNTRTHTSQVLGKKKTWPLGIRLEKKDSYTRICWLSWKKTKETTRSFCFFFLLEWICKGLNKYKQNSSC